MTAIKTTETRKPDAREAAQALVSKYRDIGPAALKAALRYASPRRRIVAKPA